MYAFVYYVPQTHLDTVNEALFAAGAGRIGDYDKCCWTTLGRGQYQPLEGSSPFHGEIDRVTQIDEYKVEMVCEATVLTEVITALKKSHPYETPAYHFWEVNSR